MPFGRTNPQKRNFVIRCCPWISEKKIRWAERTLKNVILQFAAVLEFTKTVVYKERTVSPLLKRRAAVSELCKKRAVRGLLKKILKAKQHFSNSPLTALSLHTSLLSVRHLRRGLLALSLEASLKSFLVVFGSQATQCVKVISCFGLNLETSQADLACYHRLFLPGIYLTDRFGLGVCQTLWSQGGRPCFVSTAVAS